jgi:hypothetical protein
MLAGLSHNLTAPTGSVSVGPHTGFYFVDFPNPIASNARNFPGYTPDAARNPDKPVGDAGRSFPQPDSTHRICQRWVAYRVLLHGFSEPDCIKYFPGYTPDAARNPDKPVGDAGRSEIRAIIK